MNHPEVAIVGERLTLAAFSQLSGTLAGHPFVKIVVDRHKQVIHFLNHHRYQFHADYICESLLGMTRAELDSRIDEFNKSFYHDLDRRFYLGVLAMHQEANERFFSLETVEDDTMTAEMIKYFYGVVKANVDPAVPLLFKPASHAQEGIVLGCEPSELPRVFNHELFATTSFLPLNPGRSKGCLRVFETEREYQDNRHTLKWHDIIVMPRVPDNIPRVLGIINADHTTPLSHTNVLASGWQIPNAIELGVIERIRSQDLNNRWVEYVVEVNATRVELNPIERPHEADNPPSWTVQKIKLEEPETTHTPIQPLNHLRMPDRYKYGTKAANLGELQHVLENGSERLVGFYKIPRPPRPNLMAHLARQLGAPETADMGRVASRFLRENIKIPRGIAIPFSVQQEFLQSSPKIQQMLGKLKMALELNARQVDSLAVSLQQVIVATRISDRIRYYIDGEIASHLSGVSSFVVRSSSNAEDLGSFSAAGIYESVNHVTTAENIFESIKQVWASLLSPRSVRLREEVGISLDDSYMGVIVQEEVPSTMGGVMVTTNPLNREGFRDCYLNVSSKVTQIVQGAELPYQCLYNVVEGGGRTLSMGDATEDLSTEQKSVLQRLALAGKLLQSHFSPDYMFASPVDIEWLANGNDLYILQLRPYAK